MELKKIYDRFILDKKSYVAADSVRYYQDCLSGFLSWADSSGILDSEQLDPDVLKGYCVYLRDVRKIKNTSISTYFRGIKNFCLYCIENHYCDYFNYKIKLPRQDPDLVLPLTASEALFIFDYIDKNMPDAYIFRDHLIVRLMLDMGLRRSEVVNLRKRDIDYDKKILNIVDSKFNKSRMLPIPPDVMFIFYSIGILSLDPADPVICISGSGIESFFARLKRGTGIERLHPHLLRHTFASSYMLQRNNLEYLRVYMGHSSYNVTQRYIHLSLELMLCSYDCYKIDPVFK